MITSRAKQRPTPDNVEDLINSIWFPKLRTLVSKYKLNEPVDDTLNDILLSMIEKGYLQRFDPKLGSYSTWIYNFSANICKKKYIRSNTKGGKAIEGALIIVRDPDFKEKADRNSSEKPVAYESGLADTTEYSYDFLYLCEIIEQELKKYPANSSITSDGIVYERDMLTVFRLMLRDFTPHEIAKIFRTSNTFVYYLINRMRTILRDELEITSENLTYGGL